MTGVAEQTQVMQKADVIRFLKGAGYDVRVLRVQMVDATHSICRHGVVIGRLGLAGVVMPELGMCVDYLPQVVELAEQARANEIPYVLENSYRIIGELECNGKDELAGRLRGL